MPGPRRAAVLAVALLAARPARADCTNFEVAHVHPIALTPSRARLLAVNTPDARLEVFRVEPDGSLSLESSVPVGLEPVSVTVRGEDEAWVVNQLSDSVSVVDLAAGAVVRTLAVGDEPGDVAFARGRAFVAVAGLDQVKVFDLADLDATPSEVAVAGRKPRALAVSPDGATVYAVALLSGNETTVVNAGVAFGNDAGFDPLRAAALGLDDLRCKGAPPPPYPPLPAGIARNRELIDPPDGVPRTGLITRFEPAGGRFLDEAGGDWSHCLPFRPADRDLFAIDAGTLAVTAVAHLGTLLLDVSVHPASGRVYVPHTEARNHVRFEHRLGVRGHVVDNRLAVVDPASGFAVTEVDLNGHVDRASDPRTNLAEREASVSQPGMLAWRADGSTGYLAALGSRRVFAVDGSCLDPGCIFGPERRTPRAVEVGDGPSGLALDEGRMRLYVLLRVEHAIAVVDAASLTRLGEVKLHDPTPAELRRGRRFLYDAVDGSAHGDAACSSCHFAGDRDGLAWDLGDPEGDFVPYSRALDNVRFVIPIAGRPESCAPEVCAAHAGFDPQKGPMATQTLRGMLEPLHWRGDRATFRDFNAAFVTLLGAADLAAPGEEPAGLGGEDMAAFRRFALGIRFPPNPFRPLDDVLPDADVPIPGSALLGNPRAGEALFRSAPLASGEPCAACHASPFGSASGRLGGVEPAEPAASAAAALMNGDQDRSPHSDLKVPHLRNLHEKLGPRFDPVTRPEAASGFGLTHDGSVPDLLTFLSARLFQVDERQARDLAAFLARFPTGTRPCVGVELTVPGGPPPTGSPAEESRLVQLLALADRADPGRHGELVAAVPRGGRSETYHLAGGLWSGERQAEPPITTADLRARASAPVTFRCAPIESGPRLGGDRDDDGVRDGDDCAPLEGETWAAPGGPRRLDVLPGTGARLEWDAAAGSGMGEGASLVYEVVGGLLTDLRRLGPGAATACVQGDIGATGHDDARPTPAGDGFFYHVRARNSCGAASFGPGLAAIDPLDCRAR